LQVSSATTQPLSLRVPYARQSRSKRDIIERLGRSHKLDGADVGRTSRSCFGPPTTSKSVGNGECVFCARRWQAVDEGAECLLVT